MFTIKTVYHIRGKAPKVTRSKDANRAVATAVRHMMINHYGAHICEVYDEETGELHAQLKLMKNGSLVISFMRDPTKFEVKYALSFLVVE